MSYNIKGSEQVALLGFITPTSQGVGALTSGWLSLANFQKALAIISVGTFGKSSSPYTYATVDATIQQATTSGGAGAKVFTNSKAITQVTHTTGDNVQVEIDLDASEFDVENSFNYFQLSVTVAGYATLTSAVVLGFNGRYAPAGSTYNNASVVQVL